MKFVSRLVLLAALAGFGLSPAFAQSTSSSPPPASSAATSGHSAKSIECSKEADAKGLHGKARKKFRSKCKRDKT
jgi:psiF repeat